MDLSQRCPRERWIDRDCEKKVRVGENERECERESVERDGVSQGEKCEGIEFRSVDILISSKEKFCSLRFKKR